jgi:hypothetical protein
MATLVSALDTLFSPAAGDFIVQVTGGTCSLQRRNTSGAAWANVSSVTNSALVVSNPVAGAQYQFVTVKGSPAVQADQ